jgi:hypothetical protein
VRPDAIPLPCGIGSENAAHRFAVEWGAGGQTREGVYIPRRDTSSRLNALAGGRLFPGEHHHAAFDIEEAGDHVSITMRSDDGSAAVHVSGTEADSLPGGSIFGTVQAASDFFEGGSLGYSATRDDAHFDGLELRCDTWRVTPLRVERVESSFFDNADRFPPGTVAFDNALLMRDIPHRWLGRDDLCCEPARSA